jgi:hypothetical protein
MTEPEDPAPALPESHALEAQAAAGRWWGVQLYGTNLRVDHMDELGSGWLRVPLEWKTIEPTNTTPANYQWPTWLDQQLAQLSARNVRVILTLMGNPAWAATYEAGPIDKANISQLVEFMKAAVARYGAAPYNVKHWEIYNEPDNARASRAAHGGWGYFGNQPGEYVKVLAALYAPIKAVDPQAQVVFGGLAYDGWDNGFVQGFLDEVLKRGGGAYFDLMNFHYFTYYRNLWNPYGVDIVGKTNYIRNKLQSYGVNKPQICTEACMGSNPGFGTEELQARYVPQLFARSKEADLDFTVWWWLYDFSNIEQDCGLLKANGSPKPAYYAFQTLARELSSTQYVRSLSSTQIEAYEFETVNGSVPVIVAWSTNASQRQMVLEAEQIVVVDKFGGTTTISDNDDGQNDGEVTIAVGPSPVYLRYPRRYTLTTTTIGAGSVQKTPERQDYAFGDLVKLTPIPDADWYFGHWDGTDAGGLADNGDGTWSLTMDADKTLTAVFTQQMRLTITTTGRGTIERTPNRNDYPFGRVVVLTPRPSTGWYFDRWGGTDAEDLVDMGNGNWSLAMASDRSLTATFSSIKRYGAYLPAVYRNARP